MSQNSDTHSVCNERLEREGEKATCCNCNPHDGCTLGLDKKKECEHLNKVYQGHSTVFMTYPPIYLTSWICDDCGCEGTLQEKKPRKLTYEYVKKKWEEKRGNH